MQDDIERTPAAAGELRERLLARLFGTADVPDGLTETLLRTSDVAALFQVSERTVADWAKRGRIPSVRTPGGHRRYPAGPIRDLLVSTRAPEGSALLTEKRDIPT